MKIAGSIALVTGANRGLGRAFVRALLDAGAARVYAAARDPDRIHEAGATPLALDITDPQGPAAAAFACADVNLLVNNAGVAGFVPLLAASNTEHARLEMETNYFGTLAMCRAFAPVLARNGGGTLVNMLSTVSWFNAPMQGSYCASKAAQWSLTKGVRLELRAQRTLVVGVYAGYVDTDMAAHITGPKSRPDDIAAALIKGIEAGDEEILADQRARDIRGALGGDPQALDADMQRLWNART